MNDTVLIGTMLRGGVIVASLQIGGGFHGEHINVAYDNERSQAENHRRAAEILGGMHGLGDVISSATEAGPGGRFVVNHTLTRRGS